MSHRSLRATLLPAVLLVALGAACSGSSVSDASTPKTTARQAVTTTSEAEPTLEPDASSTPPRIVAVDDGTLALLLDLGVVPIAAGTLGADAYGDSEHHPALQIPASADIITFLRNEPNYELIASLKPDLIVGSSFAVESRVGDGGTTYESIAPLVTYDSNDTLLDQVRELGHLVGVSEQADLLIEEFLTTLSSVHDQVDGARLSIARPFGDTEVFVYTSNEPVTSVWADVLGVEITPRPDSADERGYFITSGELIGQLDGEYLLTIGGLDRLAANPLWDSLPSVQAGKVYDLGDYLTYSGYGGISELTDRLAAFAQFLVAD